MSETEREVPENVDPETGEVLEPVEEPEPGDEPETVEEPEGRCEAVTTAGGTEYRCSLQEGHDDEHYFQSVEATDDGDEATQEAAFTEKELDKLQGKLDAESARHRKRVGEIMGESAGDLLDCPLCAGWIDGKIPPVQPPDEVVTAVKQALGLAVHDDYQPSKHHVQCDDCGGRGGVVTGSLVGGNEIVSCLSCNGSGFKVNAPHLAPAGMVPPPNGSVEPIVPTGLNPEDPFVVEARARGMMVMPLPTMPTYEETA